MDCAVMYVNDHVNISRYTSMWQVPLWLLKPSRLELTLMVHWLPVFTISVPSTA